MSNMFKKIIAAAEVVLIMWAFTTTSFATSGDETTTPPYNTTTAADYSASSDITTGSTTTTSDAGSASLIVPVSSVTTTSEATSSNIIVSPEVTTPETMSPEENVSDIIADEPDETDIEGDLTDLTEEDVTDLVDSEETSTTTTTVTTEPPTTTLQTTAATTTVATTIATTTPAATEVVSVWLNEWRRTLYIGETFQLETTISSNANNSNIRYYSLNMNVASVDQSGLVTANAAGTTTITAINDASGSFATVNVTVIEREIIATDIDFEAPTTVEIGKRIGLNASVLPSESNQTIIYYSADTEIASVDENGLVLGVKEGVVTITLSTADGSISKTTDIEVVSSENNEVVNIIGQLYSQNGGPLAGIRISINSSDNLITDEHGFFEFETISDSTYIAEVEHNNSKYSCSITPEHIGDVYLMLKDEQLLEFESYEQLAKKFDISSISFLESEYQLQIGETANLKYDYMPQSVEVNSVEFINENDSIVSVSADGTITAKKIGSSHITLRLNNSGITANCNVIVADNDSSENSLTIVIVEMAIILIVIIIFITLYKNYRYNHSKDEDF